MRLACSRFRYNPKTYRDLGLSVALPEDARVRFSCGRDKYVILLRRGRYQHHVAIG